jgi:hypothetical protein
VGQYYNLFKYINKKYLHNLTLNFKFSQKHGQKQSLQHGPVVVDIISYLHKAILRYIQVNGRSLSKNSLTT